MASVVADTGAGLVLMHMRGGPPTCSAIPATTMRRAR